MYVRLARRQLRTLSATVLRIRCNIKMIAVKNLKMITVKNLKMIAVKNGLQIIANADGRF